MQKPSLRLVRGSNDSIERLISALDVYVIRQGARSENTQAQCPTLEGTGWTLNLRQYAAGCSCGDQIAPSQAGCRHEAFLDGILPGLTDASIRIYVVGESESQSGTYVAVAHF